MYHTPDSTALIVDDLVMKMKKCIEANPALPVGNYYLVVLFCILGICGTLLFFMKTIIIN